MRPCPSDISNNLNSAGYLMVYQGHPSNGGGTVGYFTIKDTNFTNNQGPGIFLRAPNNNDHTQVEGSIFADNSLGTSSIATLAYNLGLSSAFIQHIANTLTFTTTAMYNNIDSFGSEVNLVRPLYRLS